jgi:hypothetical protein
MGLNSANIGYFSLQGGGAALAGAALAPQMPMAGNIALGAGATAIGLGGGAEKLDRIYRGEENPIAKAARERAQVPAAGRSTEMQPTGSARSSTDRGPAPPPAPPPAAHLPPGNQ